MILPTVKKINLRKGFSGDNYFKTFVWLTHKLQINVLDGNKLIRKTNVSSFLSSQNKI